MKNRSATEQLLISDAVDRSISQIDFRVLAGKSVYLDTQYIRSIKGIGFVNADYIVSGLRQHMTAANCLIQESMDDAEYVVEPRIGALGSDDHEVSYGVPASGAIASATSLFSNSPSVPIIPEVSIAKRNQFRAAAKLAVFAYHRQSRRPVWQSGLSKGESKAQATWLLGAGPFQRGSIYDSPQFAGTPIPVPYFGDMDSEETRGTYYQAHFFEQPRHPDLLAPARKEPSKNEPENGNPYIARQPETERSPRPDTEQPIDPNEQGPYSAPVR